MLCAHAWTLGIPPVVVQHAYRTRMHMGSDSFHALHKPIVCARMLQEPFSVL